MDAIKEAKKWLQDYNKTQPSNLQIDEDSFDGSAYRIISNLLAELKAEKQENGNADTWTVTAELTVFAGDMSKENVISNAEAILESITDGTDFTGFTVTDVEAQRGV